MRRAGKASSNGTAHAAGPDSQQVIRQGKEAMQRELQARAESFHAEYVELMQRTRCRHQPLLSLGFDGSVQWKLIPVALPQE